MATGPPDGPLPLSCLVFVRHNPSAWWRLVGAACDEAGARDIVMGWVGTEAVSLVFHGGQPVRVD